MAKLTYRERKNLPSKDFVFPGKRAYPIQDEAHGRNALARVAQHGSPAEKAKVRADVEKKYPDIEQKKSKVDAIKRRAANRG